MKQATHGLGWVMLDTLLPLFDGVRVVSHVRGMHGTGVPYIPLA